MEVNKSWVNILGKTSNPRVVWIVDRIARKIVFNISDFGFGEDDQIVHFSRGTFSNVSAYLERRKPEYGSVTAIVFLFMGMDEIAVDVPADQTDRGEESRFHPLGPRQIPADADAAEVVARFSRLIGDALQLFPSASIFSTNPAPRRSSGFAVARATYVTKKLRKVGERHHHFSLLKNFHGKLYRTAGNRPGGRLPIREEFMEENGIELKKGALTGVIVKARMVVNAVLKIKGCRLTDPNTIHDVKMFF